MDYTFDDEQIALRASAREVLLREAGPAAYRLAFDSATGVDTRLWKTIAELGWLGGAIGQESDGVGLGWIEHCIIQEEAGRSLAAVPFFSTAGLTVPVVQETGEGTLASGFLRRVATGKTIATVAAAERAGRWEAEGIEATATWNGRGWELRGVKTFVPDAHVADEIVVAARTAPRTADAEGVSLFLVPARQLPSPPRPYTSLDNTRRLCEVALDGLEVGPDQLLGAEGEGWAPLSRGLNLAAVSLAAEAAGVAQRATEIAVDYAKARTQFGRPIGSFQAVSHRLANMYMAAEGARSTVYYAAWALDERSSDAALATATAKVSASEAARAATAGAIQVHGGVGFTWEHDMHLYLRRARFCETFLGDAVVWRDRVARLRVA